MKLLRILTFSLFAFTLANCSLEIAVEDLTGPDFLKSSVISETVGISDGVNELIVTIELRNSDDTLVVDHVPTMAAIAGASVTLVGCTASNASGISTCRLKSTVDGTKTISFTNIEIELTEDVVFDPPVRNGTFLKLANCGNVNEAASGYKVTSWCGGNSYHCTGATGVSGVMQSPSGYKFRINTSAGFTPED